MSLEMCRVGTNRDLIRKAIENRYCLKFQIHFVEKTTNQQKHTRFKKTRQNRAEPLSTSSLSLSSDSEHSDYDKTSIPDEPHIFKKIPPNLLAQHGGQLLVLSQLYTGQHFTKDKTKKLIPGIIVMGTQVRDL